MDDLTEHLEALERAAQSDCLPEQDRALLQELFEFVTSSFRRSYEKEGWVFSPSDKRAERDGSDQPSPDGQGELLRVERTHPEWLDDGEVWGEREDAALRLVAHWQRTYERKQKGLTRDRWLAARSLLDAFNETELVIALDNVRKKPSLVGRRPMPDISVVFRSTTRVMRALGIKLDVNPRDTWLTPYDKVWRAQYGGKLPFGIAAKELKPLEDEYGPDKVLEHFTNFLVATAASYASIPRFRATFGSWSGSNAKKLMSSDRPIKATVQ